MTEEKKKISEKEVKVIHLDYVKEIRDEEKALSKKQLGGYSEGEWDNEEDYLGFIEPETGLECIISRRSTGSLNGYVESPYVLYDVGTYLSEIDMNITFSGRIKGKEKYYVGFDSGSSLQPYAERANSISNIVDGINYKNMEYVKNECLKLAKQIKNHINNEEKGE
jgi:hypothetical protein